MIYQTDGQMVLSAVFWVRTVDFLVHQLLLFDLHM